MGVVEWGIEAAYGQEPEDRLRGCVPCSVTWFGTDDRCWVCGGRGDGSVAAVPTNGSETWCAARCADAAEADETAAVVRRIVIA